MVKKTKHRKNKNKKSKRKNKLNTNIKLYNNNKISFGDKKYKIIEQIGELSSNALLFKVNDLSDNKIYILKITYNKENPESLKEYRELFDSGIYEYNNIKQVQKKFEDNVPNVYNYGYMFFKYITYYILYHIYTHIYFI